MKFFGSFRAPFAARVANTLDGPLLRDVQVIFTPMKNLGHKEGLAENN